MLKTVSSYINAIGALVYKGTWNASTNTPTLASSVGNQGDYYIVSVAGSTNLNGITDWQVNDFAVFNGSVWQKIDNTDAVLSVNGQTGAVVLTAPDVGATPNTAYVLTSGLLSGGGRLTGNVTVDLTSVPVANVPGAVPNTVYVLAGGNLTGGGALTGNVTISNPYNGTVTNIATGTGLTGGPITTTGTISLANTAVTAGTYGNATAVSQVTIDGQGRITSAANVGISIASGNVTGLGTMATQNANSVVITGGTINSVAHTSGTFANVNITSVAVTFPNSYLANSTATLGNTTITLGSTTTSVGNLTLANANISATTTANATFATSSLPLVPEGYITILINGSSKKIPYYGV